MTNKLVAQATASYFWLQQHLSEGRRDRGAVSLEWTIVAVAVAVVAVAAGAIYKAKVSSTMNSLP